MPADTEALRYIAEEIRLERDRLGDEGDYPEAHRYHRRLAEVRERLRQEEKLNEQITSVREKSGRHQELESVVDAHAGDWDCAYEQFRARAEEETEQMRRLHEEELERFDAASPFDFEYATRKRSPRLLQLRHKETRLVLTKRFDEAEQQKQEADDKEEAEIAKALARQRQEHIIRRRRLVNEQEKDMQALVTLLEMSRQKMLYRRDKVLTGYLNRMNKVNGALTTQLEELKLSAQDVCDPEPDGDRMDFACRTERTVPVPIFPRIPLETRLRSPKPRRKGLFPRNQSD
jgi:hypothetical protein